MPWMMDQLRRNNTKTGKRLLDVFTAHIYPQGGEFGNDVSPAMQDRRNRSTRSLWDPNYVDETWIKEKVRLIPRLKEWIKENYPGTQIGITEYNWGAEGHINGATAQADVLGIFGREGLDLANRWTAPAAGSPVYNAIKIYRNYDDKGSQFGDMSVKAESPDPDKLSVFAAIRSSDQALTVMAICKQRTSDLAARINLAGAGAAGKAQVWQLTSANKIARISDAPILANRLRAALPAQSITLFVIPRGR
jgi:hypothetical protein